MLELVNNDRPKKSVVFIVLVSDYGQINLKTPDMIIVVKVLFLTLQKYFTIDQIFTLIKGN